MLPLVSGTTVSCPPGADHTGHSICCEARAAGRCPALLTSVAGLEWTPGSLGVSSTGWRDVSAVGASEISRRVFSLPGVPSPFH